MAEDQPEAQPNVEKVEEPSNAEGDAKDVPKGRVVTTTNFSHSKYVKVEERVAPSPGAGEILIKVNFCGVNLYDVSIRQGHVPQFPKCPITLGTQCVGSVIQLGEGAEKFKIDDKVIAIHIGAWADYVVVPEKCAFLIPEEIELKDAASFGTHYLLAYYILFKIAHLCPGNIVLINSAGGALGHAVIQLSRTVENVKVIGMASKTKHGNIESSVDFILDYSNDWTTKLNDYLKDIGADDGVDVIVDCIGGDIAIKGYFGLLKATGKLINCGAAGLITRDQSRFSIPKIIQSMSASSENLSLREMCNNNRTVSGINLYQLIQSQKFEHIISSAYQEFYALRRSNSDTINPVVDKFLALEEAVDAIVSLQEHGNVGQIILDLSLAPSKPELAPKKKGKEEKTKPTVAPAGYSELQSSSSDTTSKQTAEEVTEGSLDQSSTPGKSTRLIESYTPTPSHSPSPRSLSPLPGIHSSTPVATTYVPVGELIPVTEPSISVMTRSISQNPDPTPSGSRDSDQLSSNMHSVEKKRFSVSRSVSRLSFTIMQPFIREKKDEKEDKE